MAGLAELIEKTNAHDSEAKAELSALLDSHPAYLEKVGSLLGRAKRDMLAVFSGNEADQLALGKHLAEIKQKLAGSRNIEEDIVADVVILNLLKLIIVEYSFLKNMAGSPNVIDIHQRWMRANQRMLFESVKTLRSLKKETHDRRRFQSPPMNYARVVRHERPSLLGPEPECKALSS
jgi:hypothetical protein